MYPTLAVDKATLCCLLELHETSDLPSIWHHPGGYFFYHFCIWHILNKNLTKSKLAPLGWCLFKVPKDSFYGYKSLPMLEYYKIYCAIALVLVSARAKTSITYTSCHLA
jgi:hypothetical protein